MATLRLPMLDGGNRAIGFALLVSLALHVALLVILPSLREAQQRRADANPLQARLIEPPPKRLPEPVPQSVQAEPPKPTAPQPAPKRPQPPRATPVAPVQPQASTSEPPVLARAEPADAAPPMPVNPAPSVIAGAPGPQPAAPAPDALDAGTLAQYRLAIISAARRYKRYPRVALEHDWQGRVEIRLMIGANGEISALNVRMSAGHTVLDQHAAEMIERATAMVQIPPALRDREFALDIPVVFSLREAGG